MNIRIAIIGVGNCASALVQGLHYYDKGSSNTAMGVMNWDIGGYLISDIKVVAAYDIDDRKVGLDINEAIYADPNCTRIFSPGLTANGTIVKMGKILDGVAPHMENYPDNVRYIIADRSEPTEKEVVEYLVSQKTDVLINFLPVGSQQATEFYINCALKAGVGVVNCVPVFIASTERWQTLFRSCKLPIIGDDIKSQFGATIVHRVLVNALKKRGVIIKRMYQLNVGGNTDFLNMLDRNRLSSKKVSKTEAVTSQLGNALGEENIHIGPSDYIPWLKDNKNAFIRIDGELFSHVPFNLELKISVEDSPNAACIVVDAIRCCKLALDRKIYGVLSGPSAYFMKHPPNQYEDEIAYSETLKFINNED